MATIAEMKNITSQYAGKNYYAATDYYVGGLSTQDYCAVWDSELKAHFTSTDIKAKQVEIWQSKEGRILIYNHGNVLSYECIRRFDFIHGMSRKKFEAYKIARNRQKLPGGSKWRGKSGRDEIEKFRDWKRQHAVWESVEEKPIAGKDEKDAEIEKDAEETSMKPEKSPEKEMKPEKDAGMGALNNNLGIPVGSRALTVGNNLAFPAGGSPSYPSSGGGSPAFFPSPELTGDQHGFGIPLNGGSRSSNTAYDAQGFQIVEEKAGKRRDIELWETENRRSREFISEDTMLSPQTKKSRLEEYDRVADQERRQKFGKEPRYKVETTSSEEGDRNYQPTGNYQTMADDDERPTNSRKRDPGEGAILSGYGTVELVNLKTSGRGPGWVTLRAKNGETTDVNMAQFNHPRIPRYLHFPKWCYDFSIRPPKDVIRRETKKNPDFVWYAGDDHAPARQMRKEIINERLSYEETNGKTRSETGLGTLQLPMLSENEIGTFTFDYEVYGNKFHGGNRKEIDRRECPLVIELNGREKGPGHLYPHFNESFMDVEGQHRGGGPSSVEQSRVDRSKSSRDGDQSRDQSKQSRVGEELENDKGMRGKDKNKQSSLFGDRNKDKKDRRSPEDHKDDDKDKPGFQYDKYGMDKNDSFDKNNRFDKNNGMDKSRGYESGTSLFGYDNSARRGKKVADKAKAQKMQLLEQIDGITNSYGYNGMTGGEFGGKFVGGKFQAAGAFNPWSQNNPLDAFQFQGRQQGKKDEEQERRAQIMKGLSRMAIRRMARRGGVKRISAKIYSEARDTMGIFMEKVLKDTVTYLHHSRRTTVKPVDVVNALKRQGKMIYGYGN